MVQYGRPSRSSWAKSVQSSFGKTVMGKTVWENPIAARLEKVPNWECLFVHHQKKNWLGRNKTLTQCGKYPRKKSIWENRHHALTMFMWVVLNENVKQAKILWTITEICLIPKSLQEPLKSYLTLRNLAQTFLHGPMIWKVMQRNVWNDVVSWRTEQLNSFFQSRKSMPWRPSTWGRRNGICWRNVRKNHRLFGKH